MSDYYKDPEHNDYDDDDYQNYPEEYNEHGYPNSFKIDWGAWDNKFNMPEHFNHPTNAEEYCNELEERGPTILFIRSLPNFKKSCLRKSSVYNFEENLSDDVSLFKRN